MINWLIHGYWWAWGRLFLSPGCAESRPQPTPHSSGHWSIEPEICVLIESLSFNGTSRTFLSCFGTLIITGATAADPAGPAGPEPNHKWAERAEFGGFVWSWSEVEPSDQTGWLFQSAVTSWPRFYSSLAQKYTTRTFWVLLRVFPDWADGGDGSQFQARNLPEFTGSRQRQLKIFDQFGSFGFWRVSICVNLIHLEPSLN